MMTIQSVEFEKHIFRDVASRDVKKENKQLSSNYHFRENTKKQSLVLGNVIINCIKIYYLKHLVLLWIFEIVETGQNSMLLSFPFVCLFVQICSERQLLKTVNRSCLHV